MAHRVGSIDLTHLGDNGPIRQIAFLGRCGDRLDNQGDDFPVRAGNVLPAAFKPGEIGFGITPLGFQAVPICSLGVLQKLFGVLETPAGEDSLDEIIRHAISGHKDVESGFSDFRHGDDSGTQIEAIDLFGHSFCRQQRPTGAGKK